MYRKKSKGTTNENSSDKHNVKPDQGYRHAGLQRKTITIIIVPTFELIKRQKEHAMVCHFLTACDSEYNTSYEDIKITSMHLLQIGASSCILISSFYCTLKKCTNKVIFNMINVR